MNIQFSKEDIQMAKKHMKSCSTLLIITEMQIKTTVRYHFICTRIATTKKTENNSVEKDVKKHETSYIASGNVIQCSHCGKWFSSSTKN